MTALIQSHHQRIFHNAHFGAKRPAAILLVKTNDGRFLGVRRSAGNELGRWGIIGGMVDPGETPEAAAVREAYEEGRFTPPNPVKYLDTVTFTTAKYGETPIHIFITNVDHPANIKLNREHDKLGWFHLNQWPAPRTFTVNHLIDTYGHHLKHESPTPRHI